MKPREEKQERVARAMRFPVFIGLRRSMLLTGALCAMHGVAAAVFLLVPLPPLPFFRVALLIPLAVSLGWALRPPRVRALRLQENGVLECLLADGTSRPAALRPDTTVFSWLVVLRLDLDGEKHTVSLPLLTDHMPREEFRALCVWLRWSVGQGEENRGREKR